jgi:hypothetical protein
LWQLQIWSCRFFTQKKISDKELIAREEEEAEEDQGDYWKRRLKVRETGQRIYSTAILFFGRFHNCVRKHGPCFWLKSRFTRGVDTDLLRREYSRNEYSRNIHLEYSVRYTWRLQLEPDMHAGMIIKTPTAAIQKVNPGRTVGGSHHQGNI